MRRSLELALQTSLATSFWMICVKGDWFRCCLGLWSTSARRSRCTQQSTEPAHARPLAALTLGRIQLREFERRSKRAADGDHREKLAAPILRTLGVVGARASQQWLHGPLRDCKKASSKRGVGIEGVQLLLG